MSYLLQSLNDLERLIIPDDEWIYLLDSARKSGWSPEGTVYDFWQQIDYYCDDDDDLMHNTYMFINTIDRNLKWDGNYIEKENQILTDDDVYYFRKSLAGVCRSLDVLNFFEKGSFRIVKD